MIVNPFLLYSRCHLFSFGINVLQGAQYVAHFSMRITRPERLFHLTGEVVFSQVLRSGSGALSPTTAASPVGRARRFRKAIAKKYLRINIFLSTQPVGVDVRLSQSNLRTGP